MGLTRLAVHRPLTVLMGLLALVLMGAVAYTYLNVDRLPPLTIGFVNVRVTWPQASATDVETLVTEPIENAVSGIEGIQQISSTSSEGTATINLQLAEGVDPDTTALEVSRRLVQIRSRLPSDASDPNVTKFDPNATPIMNVAFTGAPMDELFDIANTDILPQLESVPGVGSVTISGGLQREVQVRLSYAKLAAYNLSVSQVSSALTATNVTSPAGSVPLGGNLLNVRTVGRFQTVQDIANTVVAQTAAGPVMVKDVATVVPAFKQQYQLQRLNGQEAVGLSIVNTSGSNAIEVADSIQKELKALTPLLPKGSVVHVTNDSSIFTRAALDSIQHDLLIAVFLVAGVVLLFLHDWRHTAIVLLAIPTSLVSTFLFMYIMGFTLNIMSLMALALMVGILVDDSIVVLENIHRHLQLGESPLQAAINGRSEIGLAAIAITMADVVVYTPIAFMSGTVGQLFRQYGLTIVVATLLSLLTSFTLTPMLASRWLTHDPEGSSPLARFGRWWDHRFDLLGGLVARTVPITVRVRWLVVLCSVLVVAAVASMVPLHLIGTEYTPAEDDNNFNANLQLPPGSSLDTTDQAARQLEAMVARMPEVQDYFTSVSIPGGTSGFGRGGGTVSMAVQLVDKSQRSRSVFTIINQLRAQARQIPGASFNAIVRNPIGGGGFGGISIQLKGPDLATLNQLATQVQAASQGVPGLVDVQNSSQAANPELEIQLDRAQMAALGITSQQVSTAMRTALGGSVVTAYQPNGQQQQDITLVASDADRGKITTLLSTPVGVTTGLSGASPGGGATTGGAGAAPSTTGVGAGTVVTLGQVAKVVNGSGPLQIQRTDRLTSLTLNATVNGRALGDVATDLTRALQKVPTPAGYSIQVRGSVQQFNTAITELGAALLLSLVMEYMLLVALYESFVFPLVRLLTVPLGLVGAFLLLFFTGNTINIYSIMGMIMAEGLVAKSGILLVDYANTLREQGVGRTEALAQAARTRLRPILMTSATMVFGMIPLALKLEPGAEERAPMAVVVIGGLLSSTVLTMLVVPSLYTLFDDLQAKFGALRRRRAPMEMAPAEAHGAPHLGNGYVTAEPADGGGRRRGSGRGGGEGAGE